MGGVYLRRKSQRELSREELNYCQIVSGLEAVFPDKWFSSFSLYTSVDGELITCGFILFH